MKVVIRRLPQTFEISDVYKGGPGLSPERINRALRDLKELKLIRCVKKELVGESVKGRSATSWVSKQTVV